MLREIEQEAEEEEEEDIERPVISSFAELQSGIRDIKGRVSFKSNTRTFNSNDGPVNYFNFTLEDKEDKSLRAVAFGKNYERFYHSVKRDKLYVFRNVWVKPANRQFTSDPLELQLGRNSKLEEQLNKKDLTFTRLDQTSPGSTVNLIGVIREVSFVDTVMTKHNQEVSRRHVTIVDRSQHSIWLTIWGYQAEVFEGAPGDIIVTRNARIASYAGKSASAQETVFIDPNIEEAKLLKTWYRLLERDIKFSPLSEQNNYERQPESMREPKMELDDL